MPGHEEVAGNEKADEATEETAGSEGNDSNIPRSIEKPLKSARSVCIMQEITNQWNESWQSQARNRHAKQLRRITNIGNPTFGFLRKKPNGLRGSKLYKTVELTRHQTAQHARLRSGYYSLNQYLHQLNHLESPRCDCGSGAIENVEHFLLHCPRYDRQRARGRMRMEKLLGRPRDDLF